MWQLDYACLQTKSSNYAVCCRLLIGIFRYKIIAFADHSQSKIIHLPSFEPFNKEQS
jgi:hypothetical protein